MKKFFYAAIVIAFIFLPLISQSSAQWFMFQNPMLGKEAQDFQLKTVSGQDRSFSQIRDDRAAIIFFWATWCSHCRTSLTHLNNSADDLSSKDISIVLVDLGETQADVRQYLKSNGISFDTLLDSDGSVADQYGVQGIPTFVYVGTNGIVKSVGHELLEDYEKILK